MSLDPALRVLIRPEGIGNLQIFSEGRPFLLNLRPFRGPVGPPSHPADMNLGIMNDGSIADVYREHPVPLQIRCLLTLIQSFSHPFIFRHQY